MIRDRYKFPDLFKKHQAKSFIRLTLICFVAVMLSQCTSSRYEGRFDTGYQGPRYVVASWYGPDFHGKPTSSGEIFNMNAHTCAHREFPFGTKLKITNPRNNRAIECTVNDRGPFVEGRDLDLSYATAKEIGLLSTGIVFFEMTGRDESYIRKVKVQAAEKTGSFAIQVGAFTESINAIRLKQGLDLKFNNAYIQETEIKGTTYYRVRIGNFETITRAVSVAEQLGQEGYPTVIMKAEVKI